MPMSIAGIDKFAIRLEAEKRRDDVYFAHINEERLRNSSPTLQDAWDQYQVVLQLVIQSTSHDGNDGGSC